MCITRVLHILENTGLVRAFVYQEQPKQKWLENYITDSCGKKHTRGKHGPPESFALWAYISVGVLFYSLL